MTYEDEIIRELTELSGRMAALINVADDMINDRFDIDNVSDDQLDYFGNDNDENMVTVNGEAHSVYEEDGISLRDILGYVNDYTPRRTVHFNEVVNEIPTPSSPGTPPLRHLTTDFLRTRRYLSPPPLMRQFSDYGYHSDSDSDTDVEGWIDPATSPSDFFLDD